MSANDSGEFLHSRVDQMAGGSLSYYGFTRSGFRIPKSTAEFLPRMTYDPRRYASSDNPQGLECAANG